MKKYFTRPQKMTIVQGIFSIVFIVDILQLWLIIATMNSYLGGDTGVPLPAALFSLICFAANLGLLKFLYSVDRATRDTNAVSTPYRGTRR
jgi:hypothetical protein